MKLLASLLTAAIFAAPAFPHFRREKHLSRRMLPKGKPVMGRFAPPVTPQTAIPPFPCSPSWQASTQYLVKQLREFKDGKRNDPVMKGFAATLSDGDMKNIAAWLHTQAPKKASPRTRTPSPWVNAFTAAAFRSARLPPARAATAPTAPAFRPSTRVCRVSMRNTP
jgi:hypothetical protein